MYLLLHLAQNCCDYAFANWLGSAQARMSLKLNLSSHVSGHPSEDSVAPQGALALWLRITALDI